MSRGLHLPALIVHGGAGVRAAASDRPDRRRGLLSAAAAGAAVLREGGSALSAAVAAVVVLENHLLFNAGYGSMLNADGQVEMDAGVMAAPAPRSSLPGLGTGAVAAVSHVRNPIMLAQAVMEHTRHILMVSSGAERIGKTAGIPLCEPTELVTERALERWRAWTRQNGGPRTDEPRHGTVGAAAVDSRGALAAATSTGGYPRKLAGRIGDSAILGAGFFASETGAASATGLGEAIIKLGLCRRAVGVLRGRTPPAAAARAISELSAIPDAEAGVVIIDRRGRSGWAHNAQSMEVATFDIERGLHYELAKAVR